LKPDCQRVQDRLSVYLERDLPLPERSEVEAHLEVCTPCRNAARMTGAMLEAMAAVAEPRLPEGFARDLRARLAAAGAPRTRWNRLAPFRRRQWPLPALVATAAVLALALTFVLRAPGPRPDGGPGERSVDSPVRMAASTGEPVHVALGDEAMAQIWFDAAEPIDRVRFTLEIPAGVRVMDGGEAVAVSTLTWEGSLAAGRNVIHLPLRGVARGTWTVTAKVEKDGNERAQTVGLIVNGA
jgi:Putative zinc-finger